MANKNLRGQPTYNQFEWAKRNLSELERIFNELFNYQQNKDYEMKNEAYFFLAQLKELFFHWDQLNRKQIKEYNRLIKRMKKEISVNLMYVCQTRDHIIPVEHLKDLFKGYRKILSSIQK